MSINENMSTLLARLLAIFITEEYRDYLGLQIKVAQNKNVLVYQYRQRVI